MSDKKKFTKIPGVPYVIINAMKKIVEIHEATVEMREEPEPEPDPDNEEHKKCITADINLTVTSFFGFPNVLRLGYEIILCFPNGEEMSWPKLKGFTFIEPSDKNTLRTSIAYENTNVFNNVSGIKMNFSIHNT